MKKYKSLAFAFIMLIGGTSISYGQTVAHKHKTPHRAQKRLTDQQKEISEFKRWISARDNSLALIENISLKCKHSY